MNISLQKTAPDEPATVPSTKRSMWFSIVAVMAGLSVVMLIVGLVAGWTLRGTLVADEASSVPSAGASSEGVFEREKVPMPDVRGLSEADARQVISDAGYDPGAVAIAKIPFVGRAGTVVAQDPAATTMEVGAITLSVPVEATMPDLNGKPLDEASRALAALGSRPTIRRSYVAGAQAGAVISTDPLPGTTLVEEPVLIVASGAATVPLETVKVTGSCGSKSGGTVNGNKTSTGVSCTARITQSSASWIISRAAARLQATVGLDDASDPGATVRIKIVADSQTILDKAFKYGQSANVDADVSNVLRLEVTVSRTDKNSGSAEVVLANAVLAGGSDSLSKIEVRP